MKPITILLILGFLMPAAVQAVEHPALTVHVYNLAKAPEPEVTRAITITSDIFAAAGVPLEWCLEDPSAAAVTAPTHLSVWLLGANLAHRVSRKDEVAGSAFPAGDDGYRTVAALYYDRVVRAAESAGARHGVTLGAVMAHEIGHLLLGENSHAKIGVMVAQWDLSALRDTERGRLLFVKQQADTIRSGVAGRYRAAARARSNADVTP